MTIDEGVNDEGVRRRSDRSDRTAAGAAAGRGGSRGPRHDAQRVEAAAAARPRRGARRRGRARRRPGRGGRRPGAAGRDRPPADVHRADGPAALRPRVRADQPAADGGHRPPALRRAGRRGASGSSRRASFAALRAHRRAGQDRGGPARPRTRPRRCARRWPRSGTSRRRCSARPWTEGIVLRYGGFYGPGTSLAPGGEQTELVRRRKFPVVGDGGGVWSFIHIADAAAATVAAIEHGSRGDLQHRRRRAGAGRRVVAGAGADAWAPRSRCTCPGSWGGCSPARSAW